MSDFTSYFMISRDSILEPQGSWSPRPSWGSYKMVNRESRGYCKDSFIYLVSQQLTYRQQVPIGLQHHVTVQGPLNKVQLPPLLLREVHSHIIEGHWFLKDQTCSSSTWRHPPCPSLHLVFSGEGVGLTALGRKQDIEELPWMYSIFWLMWIRSHWEPARALHLSCTLRKVDTWTHSNHNKNEQLSPKSCSILVTLGSIWTVLPASPELQTLSETKTKTRTRMDAEHEPWSQSRKPGADICSTSGSRTWKGSLNIQRLPSWAQGEVSTPRLFLRTTSQGLEVGWARTKQSCPSQGEPLIVAIKALWVLKSSNWRF